MGEQVVIKYDNGKTKIVSRCKARRHRRKGSNAHGYKLRRAMLHDDWMRQNHIKKIAKRLRW